VPHKKNNIHGGGKVSDIFNVGQKQNKRTCVFLGEVQGILTLILLTWRIW
jgi:hypothetical protein